MTKYGRQIEIEATVKIKESSGGSKNTMDNINKLTLSRKCPVANFHDLIFWLIVIFKKYNVVQGDALIAGIKYDKIEATRILRQMPNNRD